jgi:hypothetical protein
MSHPEGFPSEDAVAPSASDPHRAVACRAWIAAMAIWTIVLTWPLWTTRDFPPLLPALELPEFRHYGGLLLLAAAAFVVWPRAGWAAFVSVSAAAMIDDQTRMQPQIVSFWFLMLGSLRYPTARLLALAHVFSLWFFSGLHKLLSPGYFEIVAPWQWRSIFPDAFPGATSYWCAFGTAAACFEMILALSLLVRRLKWVTSVCTALLHVGIVATLVRMHWNSAVWPWNLTLAVVVPVWLLTGPVQRRPSIAGLAGCAVVVLSPLLFYVGMLDPYVAHCLYTHNVPRAMMYPGGERPYDLDARSLDRLNVPMPPCHRLYEEFFRRVARDGDALVVKDPRAWAGRAGFADYFWERQNGAIRRVQMPKPQAKTGNDGPARSDVR